MLHRFGALQLDEEARSLRLGGEPQKIQPLVFDLLVYLVRNASRVVPKEELMDALWPNLTVTEASLHRAVSLARAALAAGGLKTRSEAMCGTAIALLVKNRGSAFRCRSSMPVRLVDRRLSAAQRPRTGSALREF